MKDKTSTQRIFDNMALFNLQKVQFEDQREMTKTVFSQNNALANDNITEFLLDGDVAAIEDEVAIKMQDVLDALIINTTKDHNTKETAKRIAKMFVRETFAGRYTPRPNITDFPNAKQLDQLYIVGPISIRSTCAHHFQNIVGTCYIGVYPGDNVIGLSKFNRLVEWYAARPQIQEELTVQIADDIEQATKCKGLAVVIRAEHMCVTQRGVKEHTSGMTTSVLRGVLRTDPQIRQEFFQLVGKP